MLFVAITLLTLLIAVLTVIYLEDHRQQLRRSPVGTIGQIWNRRDRRRAARVPVVLQANYALRDAPDREERSRIWNISDAGLAIVVTEKLLPGAWLRLQVTLGDAEPPVDLNGQVKWTKPLARHDAKGRRMFESGIVLTDCAPDDRKRFDHYLQSLRRHT